MHDSSIGDILKKVMVYNVLTVTNLFEQALITDIHRLKTWLDKAHLMIIPIKKKKI